MREPKIAYLVKTYPKLSETFILNEILGLERLGMELEIFSLRPDPGEPVHRAVAEVKARIRYLPALGPAVWQWNPWAFAKWWCERRVISWHLRFLRSRPRRYMRAVRFCFTHYQAKRVKILSQAVAFALALERGGFDHVHAHFANLPVSVAELASFLCGIPYSFTAHAKDIYLTDPAELKRKIEGAVSVLTCTGYNQRHLTALAPGSTPVHLAYHGLDVSRFGGAGGSPSSDAETPLILSVGRLCEKKGFPYLIRACRILMDRGYRLRCRIIGSGEMAGELEALIVSLDLNECVTLVGQMTQDEVIATYRSASVFVLPCFVTDNGDRDGIPNVLMEAMLCKLPVISTGISGITELVEHMVNGLLVAERDDRGIAEAIEMLLREPATRQRFGENGQAKVLAEFALESSAKRVRDLLIEAANAVPRGRGSGAQERRRGLPVAVPAESRRPVPEGVPRGVQEKIHG